MHGAPAKAAVHMPFQMGPVIICSHREILLFSREQGTVPTES